MRVTLRLKPNGVNTTCGCECLAHTDTGGTFVRSVSASQTRWVFDFPTDYASSEITLTLSGGTNYFTVYDGTYTIPFLGDTSLGRVWYFTDEPGLLCAPSRMQYVEITVRDFTVTSCSSISNCGFSPTWNVRVFMQKPWDSGGGGDPFVFPNTGALVTSFTAYYRIKIDGTLIGKPNSYSASAADMGLNSCSSSLTATSLHPTNCAGAGPTLDCAIPSVMGFSIA